MRYLVLLVLAFSTVDGEDETGLPLKRQRIMYPFIAAMLFIDESPMRVACAGSIVSTTAILSAAHCFYGEPKNDPTKWEIKLGSTSARGSGLIYRMQDVYLSDFNNSTKQNDLALVQIIGRIEYKYGIIMPVSFAAENHVVPDGEILVVCGWGKSQAIDGFPRRLRHAQLRAVNNKVCNAFYDKLLQQPSEAEPYITNDMMCAGKSGLGVCTADSGGPLLLNEILVGIVSLSEKYCKEGLPIIFTRVSNYHQWIMETVSAFEAKRDRRT